MDFKHRNAFWNKQAIIIGHKLNFVTVNFDALILLIDTTERVRFNYYNHLYGIIIWSSARYPPSASREKVASLKAKCCARRPTRPMELATPWSLQRPEIKYFSDTSFLAPRGTKGEAMLCVRDIMQKNKQASKQASRQSPKGHSVGAMPCMRMFKNKACTAKGPKWYEHSWRGHNKHPLHYCNNKK